MALGVLVDDLLAESDGAEAVFGVRGVVQDQLAPCFSAKRRGWLGQHGGLQLAGAQQVQPVGDLGTAMVWISSWVKPSRLQQAVGQVIDDGAFARCRSDAFQLLHAGDAALAGGQDAEQGVLSGVAARA